MKNLQYFRTTQTGFVLFSTKQKMSSAFCVILLILGVVFNFYFSNNVLGEYAILYRIMSIVVPLIWIYGASSKIEINTKDKNLVESHFFGILKKSYYLSTFSGFRVVRKSTYFIYTETSLVMVFKTNERLKNLIISSMRNTIKLNELKLEITSIINNC